MSTTHRLVVTMFTDIVGYTSMMERDEELAVHAVQRHQKILEEVVNSFNGEIHQYYGDGSLSLFNSAIDAVYAAIQIQNKCRETPLVPLRIGMHLGEVYFDGDKILGNGVNISSRLQSIASEGGIYISEPVFNNVKNKPAIKSQFVGEKLLKNLEDPFKIYSVKAEESSIPLDKYETVPGKSIFRSQKSLKRFAWIFLGIVGIFLVVWISPLKKILSSSNNRAVELLPEAKNEKSIAVLPFADISPEKEHEYFADGMMEEILDNLQLIEDLKVPSLPSCKRYKGSEKSVIDIADELGVTYLLYGSVRKIGDQVRITVRLIHAATDNELWVKPFIGELQTENIFNFQKSIAQKIASSLHTKISPEVKERFEIIPTQNPEAYDAYLQAKYIVHNFDFNRYNVAEELLQKAIDLDDQFASAHALMGFFWTVSLTFSNREIAIQQAESFFEKALELDEEDAQTHLYLAILYLWGFWDIEKAGIEWEFVNQKSNNPYSLTYYHAYDDYLNASGKHDEALVHAEKMLKNDPMNFFSWSHKANSQFYNGQYDEAIETLEYALNVIGKPTTELVVAEILIFMKQYDKFFDYPVPLNSPLSIGSHAIAYLGKGFEAKCDSLVNQLIEWSDTRSQGSPSFYLSKIYAQKGEINLAFQRLEKAYQDHELEMYWIKVDPLFKPLYGDPRWKEMLKKVGF